MAYHELREAALPPDDRKQLEGMIVEVGGAGSGSNESRTDRPRTGGPLNRRLNLGCGTPNFFDGATRSYRSVTTH